MFKFFTSIFLTISSISSEPPGDKNPSPQIVFNKLNMNWEDHVTINKDLYRDADIKTSFGNPQQLKEDLNWKAKVSLEECINRLIENKFKN